ncbi:MAG TPA: hypoxanthine phosphoribosyltransferase [Chloroflexota bacterium]|nr:hypoxanthine phosphoribosyltransferase [Chloroflexota bacterium]
MPAPPIELDRPLITADQIEGRLRELAGEISRDLGRADRPVSVIVVLKGAAFFAVDLMKHLDFSTRVDFLQASSYHGGTESLGEVTLVKDITMSVAGTHVLLVEDIVDTGLTASWLKQHLASHHPASLKLVTLLDKPSRRRVPVDIDFIGFQIPDEFVLGYGLDYDEGYRNLPAVYVARPKAKNIPNIGP